MRGASEINGLRGIKSMRSTSKKSIHQVESSAYLDLYMLRKEKDRLEKEIHILEKRKKDAEKKLSDIDKQMDKLQKAEVESKDKVLRRPSELPDKNWKSMDLKY